MNKLQGEGIYGLVLGGGSSSRMGQDKGLLEYHGKPQREYLFTLLDLFCEKVFLSAKENTLISESLNPIYDIFPIASPLNGLLSAIEHNATVSWLTVPVDMPFIDEEVIRFLLEQRDQTSMATCFFDSDGRLPDPLLCVWETHAFLPLQEYHKAGNISPRDFLIHHPVKMIQSPFPDLHTNINTPTELTRFQNRNRIPE
jgi:molybdenum cofactor guanylyltransferase